MSTLRCGSGFRGYDISSLFPQKRWRKKSKFFYRDDRKQYSPAILPYQSIPIQNYPTKLQPSYSSSGKFVLLEVLEPCSLCAVAGFCGGMTWTLLNIALRHYLPLPPCVGYRNNNHEVPITAFSLRFPPFSCQCAALRESVGDGCR